MIYFIAGIAAFGISQLLLRIPMLNYLQQTTPYLWLSITSPLLLSWLIAFSAGLFEETGRLVFMKISKRIIKRDCLSLSNAVIFGLGHGLLEAFWVLGQITDYISLYGIDANVAVSIFERAVAVTFHVAMSVFAAMAVNYRKLQWYFIALAAHTILDGIIIYFSSPLLLEAVFALISLIALIIAITLFNTTGRKNHAQYKKFHKNI